MALELWRVAKGVNIDGKVHFVHGEVDPSIAGFDAPISSIYFDTVTGNLYKKIGSLNTEWKYSATITDSSDLENVSDVLGATVTDALNTLKSQVDENDVRNRIITLYHDNGGTQNIDEPVPANSVITGVVVRVKTPFDGINPELEIGTALDTDELAIANDIDLETEGTYTCDAGLVQYDSITQLIGTYVRGNSTQGIAVILVKYVTAIEVGSTSSSSSSSSL